MTLYRYWDNRFVYGLPDPEFPDWHSGRPGSGKTQADFVGDNHENSLYCQPTCEPNLGCKEEDPSASTSRGCTPTCPSTPSCVIPTCSWDPAEKQCTCPDDGDYSDDEVTCTTMENPYCDFDSVDGTCKPNTTAFMCKAIACAPLQPEKASCLLNVSLVACEAKLLEGAKLIRGRGIIGGGRTPGDETVFTLEMAKAMVTQNHPEAPPKEPPIFVRYPVQEVLERKSKRKYHFMGYPENILAVMNILKEGSDHPLLPHEETTTTETPNYSGEAKTSKGTAELLARTHHRTPDEETTAPEALDEAGKKRKVGKAGKEEGKRKMKGRGIPIKLEQDRDEPTIVGE
jgi:hypothetical protein